MSYLPYDIADCLADIETALEKGKLVLGDLTEKYPFDADKNEKTQEWVFGYRHITYYMDIVLDYICEASQSIDMIKKIEEGETE